MACCGPESVSDEDVEEVMRAVMERLADFGYKGAVLGILHPDQDAREYEQYEFAIRVAIKKIIEQHRYNSF